MLFFCLKRKLAFPLQRTAVRHSASRFPSLGENKSAAVMSSLPAEEEVAEKAAEAPEGETAEDESLLLNAALAVVHSPGTNFALWVPSLQAS